MRTFLGPGIVLLLALAAGLLWPSAKAASGTVVGGEGRIAAGSDHTCAVTEAGGAVCWGKNENGQLGDGTTAHRTIPVDVLAPAMTAASPPSWPALSTPVR